MALTKVLVATRLEERHLKAIAAVQPDLEIMYTADRGFTPMAGQWSILRGEAAPPTAEPDAALREAEIIFGYTFGRDFLARAPKLKWLQLLAAQADWLRGHPILDSQVTITAAQGIASIAVAEWILCAMLMFSKRMLFAEKNRQESRWQGYEARELNTKTLGMIGLGHIGRELARMAKTMGMTVLAVRRTVSAGPLPENVDRLFLPAQLAELLAASDFVVLCLPLTAESKGLMGEAELRSMRPSAHLINASRGPVVDERALIKALKEGWIAGAALDVFEKEPLPAESELWDAPNVLITPHISGSTEYYMDRAVELFCENLRRYLAGEKLLNVVERARGY